MSENKKLFIFLSTHLFVWTLVPAISNHNLPLDVIEALAWGSNLDWGFSKHPPMSAFAVELFHYIFGSQDWAYYLLSQVFVVFSFYIIYQLAKNFLKNKSYLIISILLLESIAFYNFNTPEFNVNVCQLPFWALSILYAWRCIKFNKFLDYALLGLFMGLGVLSKYLFLYLIIGIAIFFIHTFIQEKKFRFSVFITTFVFIIILVPHLIWMVNNDFVTIAYGLKRTAGEPSALNHVINPLIFLAKQIGILGLFFLMIYFLIDEFKTKIKWNDPKLLFLLSVTIVPIFFVFLTSLFLGSRIRTMWTTPFYLTLGLLTLYILEDFISKKKLKNFYYLFVFIFLLSPSFYLYVSFSKDNKRTDYPGNAIAKEIEARFGKNIKKVSGDEWHAGNLSYHLQSRPTWVGYKKDFNNAVCFSEFPPKDFSTGMPKKTEVCLEK